MVLKFVHLSYNEPLFEFLFYQTRKNEKPKLRYDLSFLFSKRQCEKYYADIYLNYFLKFPDL